MVKLGVVSDATGVYVRTHVFYYAWWCHLAMLPSMWDPGAQLVWETGEVTAECDAEREELLLFGAFARELMSVHSFWPERGFGTCMLRDAHERGRGRGRTRVYVVFCAGD